MKKNTPYHLYSFPNCIIHKHFCRAHKPSHYMQKIRLAGLLFTNIHLFNVILTNNYALRKQTRLQSAHI